MNRLRRSRRLGGYPIEVLDPDERGGFSPAGRADCDLVVPENADADPKGERVVAPDLHGEGDGDVASSAEFSDEDVEEVNARRAPEGARGDDVIRGSEVPNGPY